MNVTLGEAAVRAHASDHNSAISAIEVLHSGGTRVVFANADDAGRMRDVFAASIIEGSVVRTKWVRNG
jgi:hypothetical protein